MKRIWLVALMGGLSAIGARGQMATSGAPSEADVAGGCTRLLQKQDAGAVQACKAQLDQAENGPETEHMARIVANDEYGIALLAYGHEPKQSVSAFDREIALLPSSTVKPDSLQWAVAYWHRATAYQQLGQYQQAAEDLSTTENTFNKAIAAAAGDASIVAHFQDLRQRVIKQHAGVLEKEGKHAEAQKLLDGR